MRGSYGTRGTPGNATGPGARTQGVSWIDSAGRFWLFGGMGSASAGSQGDLNDLWRYSGGQWTWISGSDTANSFGTCGTMGTTDASHTPGARSGSYSWTDGAGNLWLFDGSGFISLPAFGSTIGNLNDLWRFDGSRWTWVSGSANASNLAGKYGTRGFGSPSNVPGGRWQGSAGSDGAGRLWLFGGYGRDGTAADEGLLHDLWRFTP